MLRFFPGSWIQVFPLNADPYYVRGNHAGLLYVWPTQVPGLPQKVSKKKNKKHNCCGLLWPLGTSMQIEICLTLYSFNEHFLFSTFLICFLLLSFFTYIPLSSQFCSTFGIYISRFLFIPFIVLSGSPLHHFFG